MKNKSNNVTASLECCRLTIQLEYRSENYIPHLPVSELCPTNGSQKTQQTQRPDAQIAEIVGNAWVLLVSLAV